jgi:hypothetical protein
VDPLREIEGLVEHQGRWPGTDAERRAARHLERRLREMGRDAEVEPVHVWPNWPLAHVLHALAAVVGSVLAVDRPLAGTIVVGVALLSAFGDLTGSFYLVRRLTGRRASQNVVSREDGGRPGTLVLVAHYDAARTGAAFGPRSARRRAKLGRLIRRPIGPFEPLFYSILVALVCCGLRLAGIEGVGLTVVQFVATVVLIVAIPLLADLALSGVVPGANDNASGVATVLRLAERYGGDLDHWDVWVLLPGAEEALLEGMRGWMRRHRRELDPARTAFVCLDMVGAGDVRYARREGLLLALSYHSSLIALCDQIADEDAEGDDRYEARSYVSRIATDSYVARGAGFPAIRIACLDELDLAPHHHLPTDTVANVEPDALERAFRFSSELIELIDYELGPALERDPADG